MRRACSLRWAGLNDRFRRVVLGGAGVAAGDAASTVASAFLAGLPRRLPELVAPPWSAAIAILRRSRSAMSKASI